MNKLFTLTKFRLNFFSLLIQFFSNIAEDDLELTTKILNNTICQLKRAIQFYNYIRNQFDQPPEYNKIASDAVPDEKKLASVLCTSGREVRRVLKLAKTLENLRGPSSKMQSKVKFKDDGQTFLDFISCFDFGVPGFLGLQKDVSYDKKCRICNYFLFY